MEIDLDKIGIKLGGQGEHKKEEKLHATHLQVIINIGSYFSDKHMLSRRIRRLGVVAD
jgi:hypothetical protein